MSEFPKYLAAYTDLGICPAFVNLSMTDAVTVRISVRTAKAQSPSQIHMKIGEFRRLMAEAESVLGK